MEEVGSDFYFILGGKGFGFVTMSNNSVIAHTKTYKNLILSMSLKQNRIFPILGIFILGIML